MTSFAGTAGESLANAKRLGKTISSKTINSKTINSRNWTALEAGREKFRRLFAQVNSARNIGNRFLFARLQLWSGQR